MTIPNRFGYNVSLSAQQKREQNMGSGGIGSVNTNSTSSGSGNMIAAPPPPPSSIQQSYHGAGSSGGNNNSSNYSSPHAHHHHHPSHHAHHPQQHHHATPPPPPTSITPYPQQQSSSSSSSHHGMIAAGNVSGGVSPNTPGNSNESFAYNHHAHHSQAPQQQQHHMSSQQQQSPPLGYNTAAAAHHTNNNSYHHASYHASSNEASPMMNAHHASTTPGPPSVGVASVGTYHPTNNSNNNNNMYSDNVHHHHNAHHPHMSSQQQALAPPPQQHAPSHHMQHHNAQQHQQQSVQQQSPMTPRSGSNSKSNGNRNNANGGGGGGSSSSGNNSNRKKKANKDQQATAAAITAHKNKLKEDMTHFLNRFDKIFSDVKSQSQNCHCARKRKWDEMASIKTEVSTVSVDENGNAVTTTAASNTGATDDENKMRKDEEERLMLSDGQIVPFKKRRVQTTLGTEQRELSLTVDAEQVMNWMVQSIRNFFQYSPAVQQETQGSDEQKLMQIIVQFLQSHQDQFLTQITENENSKSNSSESNQSIDYSQLRDSVSHAACFPMLFSLAKQLVDQFIALYASNNENIALLSSANGEMFIDSTLPHVQQSQTNPALIDMTVDSILVTFVGKDSQSEKQEEVSIFVERFLGLQQQYREELHYINEGQASWLNRYSEVLNEQSKLRYVSPLERTLTLRKVREKFGNIIGMLREKYMSKVFSLQENVLLRSKKRGNLPKHATNILKTWLFSNFLHPYPSETEKLELSQQTQLTLIQINNWFINARVRTWRPMLESMLQGEKAKATKNNPQMQHLHNLTPGQITAALNNNGQGPPPMQMPPPSNQRSMMQPPPMQGHMPMTQHMQPHMQAGFMPSGQPGYPSMRHEMDQGNPYMWSHQHEAEHPHPHPMMQGGMPGQFGFPAPHGGWHEPHPEDDHFPH